MYGGSFKILIFWYGLAVILWFPFHSQVQEKVQVAKEWALQLSNLNDGIDWGHHTNSFCIGTIQSLILYYYVALIH